jgi:uncharacterized protein (DUF1330 family)
MFKSYGARVLDTLTRYGGRYIARGGNIVSLEGEPPKFNVAATQDGLTKAL